MYIDGLVEIVLYFGVQQCRGDTLMWNKKALPLVYPPDNSGAIRHHRCPPRVHISTAARSSSLVQTKVAPVSQPPTVLGTLVVVHGCHQTETHDEQAKQRPPCPGAPSTRARITYPRSRQRPSWLRQARGRLSTPYERLILFIGHGEQGIRGTEGGVTFTPSPTTRDTHRAPP